MLDKLQELASETSLGLVPIERIALQENAMQTKAEAPTQSLGQGRYASVVRTDVLEPWANGDGKGC